jgi:hypothetical protein
MVVKYGRFYRKKKLEDSNVKYWLESKNHEIISLVLLPKRAEIRISSPYGNSSIPLWDVYDFHTITLEKVLEVSKRRINKMKKYGSD